MTGEMYEIDEVTATEPDGTEWPIHAAVAKAVGGQVKPFDQYQGPYVVVGPDLRAGNTPYAVAVQGLNIIRLWINDETIYREDTDESLPYYHNEKVAVDMAQALLAGGAELKAAKEEVQYNLIDYHEERIRYHRREAEQLKAALTEVQCSS